MMIDQTESGMTRKQGNEGCKDMAIFTNDAITAMTDEEIYHQHLMMIRSQLSVMNDMTTPMDIFTPGDVHALHSDDGFDYLIAATDLLRELLDASPVMTGPDAFRTWMLNKINPDHAEYIKNYACDGVSNMVSDAFWDDNDD